MMSLMKAKLYRVENELRCWQARWAVRFKGYYLQAPVNDNAWLSEAKFARMHEYFRIGRREFSGLC